MSSNYSITRVCQYCGDEFEARKVTTKFCSHKCNSRSYKANAKQQRIETSNQQVKAKKEEKKNQVFDKEMLTVKEAALFIESCRQTICSMINSGRLNATNYGIRMTRIAKVDLLKYKPTPEQFVPVQILPKLEREMRLSRKNCYSVDEIRAAHGISRDAIYALVKKNAVPQFKKGSKSYLLKSAVDAIFLHKEALKAKEYMPLSVKNYYSIDEVTAKYGMKRDAIYCWASRWNVQKVKEGKNVYLLIAEVDDYFSKRKGGQNE